MYDIHLVTKVFFVFTQNKAFQTTKCHWDYCMSTYVFKKEAMPSHILSSRCQHCPSEASGKDQWVFGEIRSSGRIGKVSQAKYGHSGCASFRFFSLLVHGPDLEVCSDSRLDPLVMSESSHPFFTLGIPVPRLKPQGSSGAASRWQVADLLLATAHYLLCVSSIRW